MTINTNAYLVAAFVLAMVRSTVFFMFTPPFNTKSIPTTVKVGFAAAFSLAIASSVPTKDLSLEVAPFMAALVTQAVVGLAMGLTVMLMFGAIQTAGSLVDTFAGFSMAAIYDPLADTSAALFGRFYQLLATTMLFASGGHLLIARGFIESFRLIPAGEYDPTAIARVLTVDLGRLFVSAIEIAGPVLACLFVTELSLGLVSRAAPSLNIFALAFPIRVGVTLLVVAIAIPLLGPAVTNVVHDAVRAMVGA